MKKNFLPLPILLAITLVSCEKEQLVSESQSISKTTTKNPPSQFEKANNMAVSTWYDYGGTHFGCSGSPTNCLEEVIITANLAEVIDESLLDNVVLGDNTVRLKGSISSSSTGYLVFLDGSTVKSVYQFKS